MVQQLPGMYWDAAKCKYFKIQASHVAPDGAKYTNDAIAKAAERKTRRAQEKKDAAFSRSFRTLQRNGALGTTTSGFLLARSLKLGLKPPTSHIWRANCHFQQCHYAEAAHEEWTGPVWSLTPSSPSTYMCFTKSPLGTEGSTSLSHHAYDNGTLSGRVDWGWDITAACSTESGSLVFAREREIAFGKFTFVDPRHADNSDNQEVDCKFPLWYRCDLTCASNLGIARLIFT